MTDLELVKACAEAMGVCSAGDLNDDFQYEDSEGSVRSYCPLHDDGQMAQLVKRFKINVCADIDQWEVWIDSYTPDGTYSTHNPVFNADLNRAVVECVAKIHAAR